MNAPNKILIVAKYKFKRRFKKPNEIQTIRKWTNNRIKKTSDLNNLQDPTSNVPEDIFSFANECQTLIEETIRNTLKFVNKFSI
jgi:hypothetical protein